MATNGKSRAASQPIAIVGMACRFPGDATSPSKLWDLCAAGRDGWSTIPHDRFDVKSFYDADDEKIGRVGRVQAEIVSIDIGADLGEESRPGRSFLERRCRSI